MTTTRIAIIGAGSTVFTRNLCSDIMLAPALRDSTIALMDIDAARLSEAREIVQLMADRRELPTRVEATLDRREAVRGADYVITTFQQGGLEAYALDIEIPRRYGVEQCVGDTLGPGGIFRGLRTIPVLLDLCRDLDDLAPDALLLNYVNPMSINTWAVAEGSGRPIVGLCHSVQGTSEMLARWIEVPCEEVTYRCAGINHQAFFLEFRHGDEDLYPAIRAAAARPEIEEQEPVRIDMLRAFGYFVTESSGHASEYVPYFRRNAAQVEGELVPRFASADDAWFGNGRTGGYLHHCRTRAPEMAREHDELLRDARDPRPSRTSEYGSYIIEAMETNRPVRINGNVPNRGLIENLPADCCVEVPCLVDGNGVQPTLVRTLPPQLAALNRACINVQELTVRAALDADPDAVHHAALLDPLTAAACTMPQVHAMVDEMLETQAQWLPRFGGTARRALP
jgi:alpha-galactosidase